MSWRNRMRDLLQSGWIGMKGRVWAEEELVATELSGVNRVLREHAWVLVLATIPVVALLFHSFSFVRKQTGRLVRDRRNNSGHPSAARREGCGGAEADELTAESGGETHGSRNERYASFSHIALNCEAHSEWINMGLWDLPLSERAVGRPSARHGHPVARADYSTDWWNAFGPPAIHQDTLVPDRDVEEIFPTRSFPKACQALASYLIHRALPHLPGNVAVYPDLHTLPDALNDLSVLDVGHGCGDSLLLLARALRPARLDGVTSMRPHAERARSRLKRLNDARIKLSATTTEGTATSSDLGSSAAAGQVWCGDAIDFLERLEHEHARGELKEVKYDLIYGLDCVYHFQTRARFLQLARKRLKAGGVVVLFDLCAAWPYPSGGVSNGVSAIEQDSSCKASAPPSDHSTIFHADHRTPNALPPSFFTRALHKLTTRLSKVPASNLKPVCEYITDLRDAGLLPIEVQDISSSVFPGFAAFLTGLGKGPDQSLAGTYNLDLVGLRGFGKIVDRWAKGGAEGAVRAVVTVAQRSMDDI